jgi:hypothetical protein
MEPSDQSIFVEDDDGGGRSDAYPLLMGMFGEEEGDPMSGVSYHEPRGDVDVEIEADDAGDDSAHDTPSSSSSVADSGFRIDPSAFIPRFRYTRSTYQCVIFDESNSSPSDVDHYRYVRDLLQRPSIHSVVARDYVEVSLLAVSQALFWIGLALRFRTAEKRIRDGGGQRPQDPFLLAMSIFRPGASRMTPEELCADFGLPPEVVAVEGDQTVSGDFYQAWRHERLDQLTHVLTACELLCSLDLRDLVSSLERRRLPFSGEEQRGCAEHRVPCRRLVDQLYERVIPLAFATLWIWKTFLRSQRSVVESEEETIILWRSLLQLHSLHRAEPPDASGELTPRSFQGVFARDISGTALMIYDTPFVTMTLRQLWVTLRALLRRTPTLQIGNDFHAVVELLMWRLSILVSCAGDTSLFDMPHFVYIPDSTIASPGSASAADPAFIVMVNDKCMLEMERSFYYLLEASWVAREFAARRIADHDRWGAVISAIYDSEDVQGGGREGEGEGEGPTFEKTEERWHETLRNVLGHELSVFTRLLMERHGWWFYAFWAELEGYSVKMHAFNVEPRAVLGASRQFDCEVVFDMLNNGITELIVLYRSALENVKQLESGPRVPSLEARLRDGFVWYPPWDIRRLQDVNSAGDDRVRANGTPSQSTYLDHVKRIVDEATGEVQYYDVRDQRRLRGDRLRLVQVHESAKRVPAGRLEIHILEQCAIDILSTRKLEIDSATLALLAARHQSQEVHHAGSSDRPNVLRFHQAVLAAADQIERLSSIGIRTTGKNVRFTLGTLLADIFPVSKIVRNQVTQSDETIVDYVHGLHWPAIIFHGGLYYVYYDQRVYHTAESCRNALHAYSWVVEWNTRALLHDMANTLIAYLERADTSNQSKRIQIHETLRQALYVIRLLPEIFRGIFRLQRHARTGQALSTEEYHLPDFLNETPCRWDSLEMQRVLRESNPTAPGASDNNNNPLDNREVFSFFDDDVDEGGGENESSSIWDAGQSGTSLDQLLNLTNFVSY